jgi:hypothetical protein
MDRPQTVFGVLLQQDETSTTLVPNIGQTAAQIKPRFWLWGRVFFVTGRLSTTERKNERSTCPPERPNRWVA